MHADKGATPLHLAASAGAAKALRILVENGADASISDAKGNTALDCAAAAAKAVGEDGAGDDAYTEIIAELKRVTPKNKQRTTKLTKTQTPRQAQAPRQTRPPAGSKASGGSSIPKAAPRVQTAGASSAPGGDSMCVGAKVLVGGVSGRIRFRGPVSFDKKGDWIGVQLDSAHGKNNGMVAGVEYFRCKPLHGVFVRPNKCEILTDEAASQLGKAPATPAANPSRVQRTPRSTTKKAASTPRSSIPSRPSSSLRSSRPGSATRTTKPSTPRTKNTPRSSRGVSRNETPLKASKQPKGVQGFGIGCKVLAGGQMGVVKYIGAIDVDEGVFIGVELSEPVGKNDGSVAGKRYFRCRDSYGKFVRPDRCTWHGKKCTEFIR